MCACASRAHVLLMQHALDSEKALKDSVERELKSVKRQVELKDEEAAGYRAQINEISLGAKAMQTEVPM
jgi:hypothetical protein